MCCRYALQPSCADGHRAPTYSLNGVLPTTSQCQTRFTATTWYEYFKISDEYFFQGKIYANFDVVQHFCHLAIAVPIWTLSVEICATHKCGLTFDLAVRAARSFHLSRGYNPALSELRCGQDAQIELTCVRLVCLVKSFCQSLWCNAVGVQQTGDWWVMVQCYEHEILLPE